MPRLPLRSTSSTASSTSSAPSRRRKHSLPRSFPNARFVPCVPRENGRYRMVAWGHIDPTKGAVLDNPALIYTPRNRGRAQSDRDRRPIGPGRAGPVGERQNIERATDDTRVHDTFDAFGPRKIVVVPLRDGDYVMVAAISDTARSFYEDDLEFSRRWRRVWGRYSLDRHTPRRRAASVRGRS